MRTPPRTKEAFSRVVLPPTTPMNRTGHPPALVRHDRVATRHPGNFLTQSTTTIYIGVSPPSYIYIYGVTPPPHSVPSCKETSAPTSNPSSATLPLECESQTFCRHGRRQPPTTHQPTNHQPSHQPTKTPTRQPPKHHPTNPNQPPQFYLHGQLSTVEPCASPAGHPGRANRACPLPTPARSGRSS